MIIEHLENLDYSKFGLVNEIITNLESRPPDPQKLNPSGERTSFLLLVLQWCEMD